ncbi:DUF4345 family protein [uncultured Tateyamaria sp.]|uniref:DUF4345 family protein n=1 Tax=uncultured Tateyamaria sp. TaxID=455651 RepID=UPI00262BC613|nr:DUF4345 family protein [uncultured Tateyamaria sp.]
MDWITLINYALVVLTIGFGALGWLAPRYTMDTVDLKDGGSTMGRSEVRAASGALFVVAGIGALILHTPAAFATIGFIWAGGGLGRLTSLILDGQTRLKWIFFASEVAVAAVALAINIGGQVVMTAAYSSL